MPTATYEQLLIETVPQVIETEKQYREIGDRFGELIGKGRSRTRNQTRLMRLLALLIEDYDRRHGLPPDDSTPAERLRFLLEHSGKTPADLLPIFRSRGYISEVLSGKRAISKRIAKALGERFSVSAELFI